MSAPRVGFLLVHKTKGILMGKNRAGKVTWSSVHPSYRQAMPCADNVAMIAVIMGNLHIPADEYRDYSVCLVRPDCEFNGDPFLSPEGVRDHGLGDFLNNYMPLDFVGAEGVTPRAERRRVGAAIRTWCERIRPDSMPGKSLLARMLFIRRMLRKGAINIEVTDAGLQLVLSPSLDLTQMEPAGHA